MSNGRCRVTRAPLRRRELYPVLAALPLLAAGIALKLPVFQYDGQPTQPADSEAGALAKCVVLARARLFVVPPRTDG
jgi:hypothetical protein